VPSHSQPIQSNGSSQLNGSDRQPISLENGSGAGIRVAIAASTTHHGHLFTEEEVQSLQRQIADLQVDLEQLLQYTHVSQHVSQATYREKTCMYMYTIGCGSLVLYCNLWHHVNLQLRLTSDLIVCVRHTRVSEVVSLWPKIAYNGFPY
jgi:hypothetical protein